MAHGRKQTRSKSKVGRSFAQKGYLEELVTLRMALEAASETVSRVAFSSTTREGAEAAGVLDQIHLALEETPIARRLVQEKREKEIEAAL